MTNIYELKQKANSLRKAGNFEESLIIYRYLWEEKGDKFDGAGLLHCLRKLELFDEAIIFAEELINIYSDFDWCRNEVIWTYISGKLVKLEESEQEKVLQTANLIMDLNPDGLAAKIVVFKVLKSAKTSNDLETINEWVIKINPNSLSTIPIKDRSGKEGWNDQSIWYNYRIKGFIESGKPNEAIDLIDEILERFPKQQKFFLRLKALSYSHLGNLIEAEAVYSNLCSGRRTDWWLLHEYSKVVLDLGKKDDALKLMYQAASSNSKINLMVTLFEDIGILCKEMGMNDEALAHLILSKKIREENSWSIKDIILGNIDELNQICDNNIELDSSKEAWVNCKRFWGDSADSGSFSTNFTQKKREIRKEKSGKVSLGFIDRPFFFINAEDGESFFGFKTDLPPDIEDGDRVVFDAIPSFDKKKNKESWKASNIRKCK